ncbi:MAG: CBS domain-containing protein [Thermoprotei archaeon]
MVLKAKEVMHTDFLMVNAELSALEAAKRMAYAHKGYVIVSEGNKPIGIVTEWDFLEKVIAREVDPKAVSIRELASSPLIACDKDTPTENVVELMVSKGIRRLIVMEKEAVVGVITSKDILSIFKKYVDEISSIVARFSATPF